MHPPPLQTTQNDNQDSGYHAAKVDIASEFSTAERVAKFHFEGSFYWGEWRGYLVAESLYHFRVVNNLQGKTV